MRNHTVKFGGEWRHNRDFLLQTQDSGGSRGAFEFTSSGTGSPAEPASTNNTSIANSFAAFLLDWPNVVRRDLKVIDPGTKHWATFAFVHDKWQVSPSVTLDLGLRWDTTRRWSAWNASAGCQTTTRSPTRSMSPATGPPSPTSA